MTQIWITLCVYLLIAHMKFQSKTKHSMQQILRMLQTNLIEKWSFDDLTHGRPVEKTPINDDQLSLTIKLTGLVTPNIFLQYTHRGLLYFNDYGHP